MMISNRTTCSSEIVWPCFRGSFILSNTQTSTQQTNLESKKRGVIGYNISEVSVMLGDLEDIYLTLVVLMSDLICNIVISVILFSSSLTCIYHHILSFYAFVFQNSRYTQARCSDQDRRFSWTDLLLQPHSDQSQDGVSYMVRISMWKGEIHYRCISQTLKLKLKNSCNQLIELSELFSK